MPRRRDPEKAGSTGSFGQPTTTGGGVCNFTSTFGQGNKHTGFGFGTRASNKSFLGDQQPETTRTFNTSGSTGLFGGSTAFSSQPTGTVVKFDFVTFDDIAWRNGTEEIISTKLHSITCMEEYENKSFEELRFEDYQANRKGLGVPSFGASTTTPSLFGQTDPSKQSVFGETSVFGQTLTFGQNSTGQQGTTGFGAPVFGASSSGTPSLFGQANANKSAFGQAGAFGQTSTFGQNTIGKQNTYDEKLCELQHKNRELEAKILDLEREVQQLKSLVGKCSNPSATSELLSTQTQTSPSQGQVALKPQFQVTLLPQKPKGQQHQDNIPELSRRLNKQLVIIGTGSGDGHFLAGERRQWLYIGRCDPKTTDRDIIDYVKNHLKISDVKCSVLAQNEDLKSFKVGVKESVLKGLLDPALWPAGTAIKELQPRRHRRGSENFNWESPNQQS